MQLNHAIERALRAREHSGNWYCVFRPDFLELRYIVSLEKDAWQVRCELVANNAWARSERMLLTIADFEATDWVTEPCAEGIQRGDRDCLLYAGSEVTVKDNALGRTVLLPIVPLPETNETAQRR